MKLYINKKIEFASSHKYFKSQFSEEKNEVLFGPASKGKYGHGHNFNAYFVFSGDIDSETGMILELSKVKQKIMDVIMCKYDHVYLNQTLDVFKDKLPTPELISEALLHEAIASFSDLPITVEACHLKESNRVSATAYVSKSLEKQLLFLGVINGKPGSVELTFNGPLGAETDMILNEFHDYLPIEHALFSDQSQTTMAMLIERYYQLRACYPLERMRISMNRVVIDIYPERCFFSTKATLYATHQLKGDCYTSEQNKELFGKCSNPHGHDFLIEVQFLADLKVVCDLDWVESRVKELDMFLDPFQYTSLDEETDLFKGTLCTCESMIHRFKSAYESFSNQQLSLFRLQETPNNRFTLRHGYEF